MLGVLIAHIRGPLTVYQALCRGFYTFCPIILAVVRLEAHTLPQRPWLVHRNTGMFFFLLIPSSCHCWGQFILSVFIISICQYLY